MTESWKGLAKAYHIVVRQERKISEHPDWDDHDKAVVLQITKNIREEIRLMVEKENPEALQQLG